MDDLAPELGRRPLPRADPAGDKEHRGRVLIVGGGRQNPGALLLAGGAALRAGAGKLRLATATSVQVQVAVMLPEARVFALGETAAGEVNRSAAGAVANLAGGVDAVLLGPGLLDAENAAGLTREVVPRVEVPMVLDAGSLPVLQRERALLVAAKHRAVITPHHGELAQILDEPSQRVAADPREAALRAAAQLGAVVVLKGAQTWVGTPEGEAWCWKGDNPGLGTSGSGDVLAGIAAGLLARGAEPVTAALWAVYLHALAGEALADRVGPVGFLAGELLEEIPRALGRQG